jgi:hypothetical protein
MIEQDYMIKLVTGNENVDPKEIINKEKHYRRGYHQGYCQAVEDFLSIKESPKTKLINHCDTLHDWRYEGIQGITGERLPPFLKCN